MMKSIDLSLLETITGGLQPLVNIQSGDRYTAYMDCAGQARARGEKSVPAARFFRHFDPSGKLNSDVNDAGDARVAKECGPLLKAR